VTEIPEVIHAVSRLNSWIRSDSARGHFAPARAIYFLKGQAIEWADENLKCLHSTVKVATTCRGCGGTGKYCDTHGHTWPHCRACSSRGRLALLFVQTAIGGGPIWHTPWLKFHVRRDGANPHYALARWAEGWTVNEPGHDMEPWEVARDLNLAETTFTKRPGWYSTDWGGCNDFHYSLYIGSTPADVCSLCGGVADVKHGYGVTRRPIHWTDHACNVCSIMYGDVFKAFSMPRQLIDNEHIQKFIERRTQENAMSPRPQWAEYA
jgi:hypothetical protein